MTKTGSAIILFFCAQLLFAPGSGAGTLTRELRLFPKGFPKQVSIVQGTSFVVCVSSPGNVAVIDENLGTIAASFPSSEESISVSSDGLSVAVVTSSSAVTIYSPASWEPVRTLAIDFPRSVKFSPDGQYFAVGRLTDEVYIYQLPAWERVYTLFLGDEDSERLTEMTFSPDGRYFAAASESRRGMAWDTADWRKIDYFKAPSSSVKFTYNGKYLSAAPAVYEVLPKKIRKADLTKAEESFIDAKLLGSRNLLVTEENGSLLLFDEATRASSGTLVSFPGEISEFDLSADGKFLVAASTSAGMLHITALDAVAGMYDLDVADGEALSARGEYAEALKKFIAAKKELDTPGINEKIAEAGYRAAEKTSDEAAAAGKFGTAIKAMQAALRCRSTEEGKQKLKDLVLKLESGRFSGIVAKADALESRYEYGAAAAMLQKALKVKDDPETEARIQKLAKQEPAAAKYRRNTALGLKALKKQDYGAAVEYFTRAAKLINTPEAAKYLEEAQNSFRR